MLVCPVHGCAMPLARRDQRVVCALGHSFDVARSGYINLLQPQDRRSKHPGDIDLVVSARRRLHDSGVTQPLLDGIAALLAASPDDVVLDVGCGDGFYLGNLALKGGFDPHGVDISVNAINAAARRYPKCEWVVANADRFLPYSNGSFSKVLSITGRMNAGEIRRVMKASGRLLVAVASSDDLIELRGAGRDRAPRTIETFSAGFHLLDRARVSTQAHLDAAAVEDVLISIYRPLQSKPVTAGRVTFSLELLLFQAH